MRIGKILAIVQNNVRVYRNIIVAPLYTSSYKTKPNRTSYSLYTGVTAPIYVVKQCPDDIKQHSISGLCKMHCLCKYQLINSWTLLGTPSLVTQKVTMNKAFCLDICDSV